MKTTNYRMVVGEKGNEQGHIISISFGNNEQEARKALKRELNKYHGDGWGRLEWERAEGEWDILPTEKQLLQHLDDTARKPRLSDRFTRISNQKARISAGRARISPKRQKIGR